MIEFKTIGLAIAFSPTAPAMLAEARRLVIYFQSKLVLIHVGEHGADEEAKMKTLIATTFMIVCAYICDLRSERTKF